METYLILQLSGLFGAPLLPRDSGAFLNTEPLTDQNLTELLIDLQPWQFFSTSSLSNKRLAAIKTGAMTLWALSVYTDIVLIGSFVELTVRVLFYVQKGAESLTTIQATTGTSPDLHSHTALENHRRGVARPTTDRSVAVAHAVRTLDIRMTQFHNCFSRPLFFLDSSLLPL